MIGTEALLQQHHRFRKTEPNARLEFEITGLTLEAIDDNAFLPTHGECPWLAPGDHDPQECATVMYASVDFTVEALGPTEGDGPTCNWVLGDECFFYEAGTVDLEGWRGTWDHDVWAPGNAMDPVWREDDFVWTPRVNGDMGHATLTLARPLVVDVPLDRVPLDSLFSVSVEVIASASNTRQRESYLGAYFRDPAGASGLDYEYSGLEPVDPPSRQPARASSQPGPVCSPGSGSAGTVQFAATEFGGAEPQRWGRVVVRRSGGDSGALAVRLTTGDGTATAGSDYTDASSWVLFADGEEGDRLVRVQFLDDAVEEPEETVTLSSRTQGAAPRSAPPPRRRSRSGTTMAPRPTTTTRSAGPRVGLRGAASC